MSSSVAVPRSPHHKIEPSEATASDASSIPTPASDYGSIMDTALLDEEDTPGLMEHMEDPETQRSVSGKKRKAYIAGEGGYNALKTFDGQVYSGMAVGGSHTWNYDPGVWKETKEGPDLWRIDYQTAKRRAKNAPKGSGAPIGTQYHWLIVAHQYVEKTDANTYETHLTGSKYKLAHKTASSNAWSVPTVKGQRDREIEILEDAKRRVQGLPPVLKTEKVKVAREERGQQKLDTLFTKAKKEDGDGEPSQKKTRRK